MTASQRSFVLFSTADWRTRYWTNKQHTAAALADLGHNVLYVETIGLRQARLMQRRDLKRLWSRLLHGLRTLLMGVEPVRPNLWVLSPLSLPWGRRHAFTRWLNARLLRSSLRRALRKHRFQRPEIWSFHPFVLEVIAGLPRSALVYVSVDDIAALPGVDGPRFLEAERQFVASCDAVFVTARALQARYLCESKNVYFVPNVVDAEHFGAAFTANEPADVRDIPHPRLGYHGVLSEQKIDVEMLAALARRRPGWHLVLIGDEWEGQETSGFQILAKFANVHLLGGRDYGALPAYLAAFDVGLIPAIRNAYTASMFPMKLYEYLAAGVPVVSIDIPYTNDVTPGPVALASDTESFIEAVSAQLVRGRLGAEEAWLAVGDRTYRNRLEGMLRITEKIGG